MTTYLTPTSSGAYGNNGEIGLKTMRKGSKTAEKRPKTGIGKLVVCLGPGEFAGSNPVTSTKKTSSRGTLAIEQVSLAVCLRVWCEWIAVRFVLSVIRLSL